MLGTDPDLNDTEIAGNRAGDAEAEPAGAHLAAAAAQAQLLGRRRVRRLGICHVDTKH